MKTWQDKITVVGFVLSRKKRVLAKVKNNGMALKNVSKRLQQDEEVVLATVTQNGMALE